MRNISNKYNIILTIIPPTITFSAFSSRLVILLRFIAGVQFGGHGSAFIGRKHKNHFTLRVFGKSKNSLHLSYIRKQCHDHIYVKISGLSLRLNFGDNARFESMQC